MTIADRLAVFIEGHIVQVGTPDEVCARPSSVAVAGFIGSPPMNLLPGVVRNGLVAVNDVAVPIDRSPGADGNVIVGVRPAAVRIAALGLPARVDLVENLGDSAIVDLTVGGHAVKLRSDTRPQVREGEDVHLAFAPDAVHLFDAASGVRR